MQKQVPPDSLVGADPKTTPHRLWHDLDRELAREFLKLSKVKNLIYLAHLRDATIKTHNSTYSGVNWQTKVEILRENLNAHRCDSMVLGNIKKIFQLLTSICR